LQELRKNGTRALKILDVIYDDINNPWCGGGGALRVYKVNERLARHHDITVLTGNFPGAKNEIINGVSYRRVGTKASYVLSRINFSLLVPLHLARFRGDVVVNEVSFFAPSLADLYTKRPVVNVIHHLMDRHAFKIYHVIGFFPFLSERAILKTAKNVITSAKSIRDEIEKRDGKKRVKNIPNGVGEEFFALDPEEKPFILSLGRIDIYMKGLDLLLEAFSRMRSTSVSLKIAGAGKPNDMKRLTELIRRLNLEKRVEYLGRVEEREKLELLRTCLFLAMPSRFEGWGITAVEANAAGKAVLGTRIRGLTEAVENEKTALLIEPERVDPLASALDFLVENEDQRRRLGRQGREWARRFSWDFIAEEQLGFYRRVLEA
jgi:glycosyltransferase involved in cell wall biosynthesis